MIAQIVKQWFSWLSVPENGSAPLDRPPEIDRTGVKRFVLVKSYPCDPIANLISHFTAMAQNAKNAGFDALLIYGEGEGEGNCSSAVSRKPHKCRIPVLRVSNELDHILKEKYLYESGFTLKITYNWRRRIGFGK